jgi:hypothetical protein
MFMSLDVASDAIKRHKHEMLDILKGEK